MLRQEDPPVVLAQDLTANMGRLTAINFGSFINANRVTPSLIKRLSGEYDISHVKAVAWGNKWKQRGEALKISEYFFLHFAIPAEI